MSPKIMTNKSYFSLSSLKIDLYFDETFLSTATGFFIKKDNSFFLVTNYHVLSGRHFETDQPLSETGAIPNKIKIWYHQKNNPWRFKWYFSSLLDKEANQIYIDGKKLNNCDIAVLKITDIPEDIAIYDIDYKDHQSLDIKFYPWQQLLIAWFPYWLSSYSLMPIWKAWILSSEIDFDFKWLNCFLIDAWTRWWMSWSPVFAYFPWWSYELNNWSQIISSGNYYKFLWIYSSRLVIPKDEREKLGDDNCKQLDLLWSDLWQAWKDSNLDIILDACSNDLTK